MSFENFWLDRAKNFVLFFFCVQDTSEWIIINVILLFAKVIENTLNDFILRKIQNINFLLLQIFQLIVYISIKLNFFQVSINFLVIFFLIYWYFIIIRKLHFEIFIIINKFHCFPFFNIFYKHLWVIRLKQFLLIKNILTFFN